MAREVDRLLNVIFRDRRKAGHLDLEAVETSIRSAMHQAGAAALTQLLHTLHRIRTIERFLVRAAIRLTTRNYVPRPC